MDIDFENRLARMGVRDFVAFGHFGIQPSGGYSGGRWRLRQGMRWHQLLAAESLSDAHPDTSTEVSIEGQLTREHWTFHLSGRIDQIIRTPSGPLIREVKTTSRLIPESPDSLRQHFPEYFEQLALYCLLAETSLDTRIPRDAPLQAEILFVQSESGIRQDVPLAITPEDLVAPLIDRWVAFLESRRTNRELWHLNPPPLAFEVLRDDQNLARWQLTEWHQPSTGALSPKCYAVEASTGFGKTALALEHSFRLLHEGTVDRVIYLTGKNSGQIQVLRELERFRTQLPDIKAFQMRSLAAHIECCLQKPCLCADPVDTDRDIIPERCPDWRRINDLLLKGNPEMKTLATEAAATGICPRTLSLACLAQSDIWIADYNYVFSSGASGAMTSIPSYNPASTLLIVDEAHNLHDRCASNFSHTYHPSPFYHILQLIPDAAPYRPLVKAIRALINFLQELPLKNAHDLSFRYNWFDLVESLCSLLEENPSAFAHLDRFASEFLWGLQSCADHLNSPRLEFLTGSPEESTFNITCLDASAWIADTLIPFGRTLFLSATFPPEQDFVESLGIDPSSDFPILRIHSQWREEAWDVAVDLRMDTRLKNRAKHHLLTTDTLALLATSSSQPVVAFFPSYLYAQTITEYVRTVYPHLSIDTIPRDLESSRQVRYIEENLHTLNILCLPLGGGLSEGIDHLGGRVDSVLVVGPALPEVNAVQETRMARRDHLSREAAFRAVYLVPGMIRVNQALGRIVRQPGHRARVLLHCKRFAQEPYLNLLAPEYQKARSIQSRTDLESWLQQ